jgi:hypothetical protein
VYAGFRMQRVEGVEGVGSSGLVWLWHGFMVYGLWFRVGIRGCLKMLACEKHLDINWR